MKLPGKGMGWKDFFVSLKNEYKNDRVNDQAAALTYFGVLALFPFLLFLVALAGLVIDPAEARALIDELATVAPGEATRLLRQRIESIARSQNVGLLSFGAVAALWAASNGVAAAIRALNVTYDVKESRPGWKVRAIAILMTLFLGALALAATLIAVASPALAQAIGGPIGLAIRLLRLPVAGLLMMFIWAVVYYALPDVEQRFKFITPGSVVGVIIWVLASWGFSLYVKNFGKYDATYGSLGGVIVLLLWMWLSAVVLLLGAEINALIEHRSEEGKRAGAKRLEEAGATT